MNVQAIFYKVLVAFSVLFFLAVGNAESAPIDNLIGHSEWDGQYNYQKGGGVGFKLSLNVNPDGSFTGNTSEPNTFGDSSASQLFASVHGSINGSRISFTKTYDGTGGVSHSITYSGTLSEDGDSMDGHWRTNISGSFSATLTQAPKRQQASCVSPSGQLRTTDNFVYWNFRNVCDHETYVSVCAEYANGNTNILGASIPPRQSVDINLGHESQPAAKLNWKEGGGIRCPN